MSDARSKNEELVFETGMERLEELIEELESGELDLDRSLAVFEEGIRLSRVLNRKLDEAEKKTGSPGQGRRRRHDRSGIFPGRRRRRGRLIWI